MDKNVYSLSQLTRSVQNVIDQYCSKKVWVKAEIVKLNYYAKTGHCYPSLVEKRNGRVVAELQGTIWNNQFRTINTRFKEVLGEPIHDNMAVVFLGHITYHPVHGLAVNILDIDPEFTLGQLAKEKAQTIDLLQKEGVFEKNKALVLPRLPKTIAVISVESSKGYQDFLEILNNNNHGYIFHHLLFPAILQGERATTTISSQLDRIQDYSRFFDAVAIIRGGGGEVGLSCFDNYELARKICTFPLPVLTGIGHSTNLTVAEMVSHQTFITPTKTAEFLIQNFTTFYEGLQQITYKMEKELEWVFSNEKRDLRETARLYHSLVHRVLEKNRSGLQNLSQRFFAESQEVIRDQKRELRSMEQKVISASHNQMNNTQQSLQFIEEKLHLLSPKNILRRGYSISRQKGKVVRDIKEIDPTEILETELFEGKVYSQITRTQGEEKP